MGYQDREYFRNQRSPYWTIWESSRATWAIILLHIAVYLLVGLGQSERFSLDDELRLNAPAMIQHWQWYRLITASFVVDQFGHLAFALILIWIFGRELENLLGAAEFLAFYLLANLLGNLCQFVLYQTFVPGRVEALAFGPSSAAMALTLVAVLQDPLRMVTYLLLPMQMWIVGLLALALDLFFFMRDVPMVLRLTVHAPTLLFAMCYHQFAWRLTGGRPWSSWSMHRPARRSLASVAPLRSSAAAGVREDAEETLPPAPAARVVNEQLEAKMDDILEKVSRQGMDSLTPEEKNILQQASEALRRKRL